MERTMRQQACEVAQLHQTIDRMARVIEAQMASDETQRLGMRQWLEERERKWNARHKNEVMWGECITVLTLMVQAKPKVGETAPDRDARGKGKHVTARQVSGGLEASQHEDTTQIGEPEKRQLQQQPEPKLQPRQQPKPRHELEPMPAPMLARRWETVPPGSQSQKVPAGTTPALTT
jgi:hypothetical protein